ncbi:hypothetical protein CLOACE_14970 [Clostridium acetireducens DSM 10703]|jgi:hypothetical protein|uniref:Uncharacterized protein n=1 Tax=Clostridium acetireducens DSM 10703 TaxID=1121290 RepID=A0A1E8EY50_9CLOT|nr:DUF6762 family protein [Clostridium acetireducens]OFI05879.1 hypothetical protein CLOACE_14970 [Clostridium acetireducens DSM 10703]
MDFSSLVLMEKDKETNFLVKEIASYSVGDGAEYIKKMFYDGELVNVYFDTDKDVEDWEYSAIFDLFNKEDFIKNKYNIEDIEDEYNPTWKVTFKYEDDYSIMESKLQKLCLIINEEIKNVFKSIEGKEEYYK